MQAIPTVSSVMGAMGPQLPKPVDFINQPYGRPFTRDQSSGPVHHDVQHPGQFQGRRKRLGRVEKKGELFGFLAELGTQRSVLTLQAGEGGAAPAGREAFQTPWHFLYFFPLPHGHGSFRPTRSRSRATGTLPPAVAGAGAPRIIP